MRYTIFATKTYDRSLNRLPKPAIKCIRNEVFELETNSRAGEPLRQKLKGLWSLHLKYKNVHYRVICSIKGKQKTVTLHYVNNRENIYKQVYRLKL